MNADFLEGIAAGKQRDYEKAVGCFTRALQTDPLHVESYYNRGLARLKLREPQEALSDFDEAVNLAPNNATVISDRAVAKHLLKRSEEALEDFNRAQKLEPNNPYRYSSRAYVRASLGDVQGAIADYRKCIALDPEDAVAHNNLGMLEENAGYSTFRQRYDKADKLAGVDSTPEEKPDIDKLIEDWRKEKQQRETLQKERLAEASRRSGAQQSSPTAQPEATDASSSGLTAQGYWQTLRSVFASKETFGEFWGFVRRGFKPPKG